MEDALQSYLIVFKEKGFIFGETFLLASLTDETVYTSRMSVKLQLPSLQQTVAVCLSASNVIWIFNRGTWGRVLRCSSVYYMLSAINTSITFFYTAPRVT